MARRPIDLRELEGLLEGETIAAVEHRLDPAEPDLDYLEIVTDSGLVLFASSPSLYREEGLPARPRLELVRSS